MAGNRSTYPTDEPNDVIRYIQHGYHVFVGCDDATKRDRFVESLQVALDGQVQEQISCGDVEESTEFVARIVIACRNLAAAVGIHRLESSLSISDRLGEVMDIYGQRNRQGFLILSDIGNLIELQRTHEIEGSLRSVMQIHDDVAVIIAASNDTIDGLVGDYDRPFYMSFRVFRI